MSLVVIGAYSLDELQSEVLKCFSDIPANPRVISPLATVQDKSSHELFPKTWDDITIRSPLKEFGMPFDSSSLAKIYRIVPVEQRHTLSIIWQLPPQQENWKTRPCDILGHLIGHEGAGSLYSALKKRSWVTSCYAGMGYDGHEVRKNKYIYIFTHFFLLLKTNALFYVTVCFFAFPIYCVLFSFRRWCTVLVRNSGYGVFIYRNDPTLHKLYGWASIIFVQ